ncbi:MAG TPA: heparinase II/III family protein [Vicinamibacterales bacterium]
MLPRFRAVIVFFALTASAAQTRADAPHPRLFFDAAGLAAIRVEAAKPALAPVARRLMARANALLTAPPLMSSKTGRGEPDPPGQLKGIESARRLQGRTATLAMAFLLSGERRYRDAVVSQLTQAIDDWPIWVDTAHQPPYDLMSGELSLTFGLAYDWLYDALTPAERGRLREGVERRALRGYLDATTRAKPMFWFTAEHNWNPVCNGGATVLALALGPDSILSDQVLTLAVPAMARYWEHLGDDGAWDEGTGYWAYGHRYAFMAADALRRAGRPEGARYLARAGARVTGYFPIVFNPGRRLTASFGDSASRAADPIFYFLAREYGNTDFSWYQDRTPPRGPGREGWPEEALEIVWKADTVPGGPGGRDAAPTLQPVTAFSSIGWAMLAPSQPDPPFFLAFKNGSLAANHTHLDLNHVSVGVGDTMVLVDLGSRPYPADYFNSARRFQYYEITTAGHNTVVVDGKGQIPGRKGTLRGPAVGPGYVAFIGIADGAYQADTPRARRHVVFVDRRYYVLLDEVEVTAPAPIELRFHTHGRASERPGGGWTVSDGGSAIDVVPADANKIEGRIEAVTGWIEPVSVLRIRSRENTGRLLLATALLPALEGASRADGVDRAAGVRRADGADGAAGVGRADGADRAAGASRADGVDRAAGVGRADGVDGAAGVGRADGVDRAAGVGRASRPSSALAGVTVTQTLLGDELVVTVGADRLVFRREADGFAMSSVRLGPSPANLSPPGSVHTVEPDSAGGRILR